MPRVVVGTHVDGPVGDELGGVDQDPPADGVHPFGQVVHRRDHAGHVRRSGDGQQTDPPGVEGEQPVEVVEVERPIGQGPHVHHPGPGSPRQIVRMVLEHRRQHDVVRSEIDRPCQQVDGVGRVPAEDHGVPRGVGPDERPDELPGLLVRSRC